MDTKDIIGKFKGKAVKTILNPLNEILDDQITDISTTLGLFAVRSIRGKLQRSITFTIGMKYSDRWMEEALYGILYQYNNIRASSKLELGNKPGTNDGSGMYYRLNDGTHNLKYRKYDILLNIQTKADSPAAPVRYTGGVRVYTIITYDLSLDFVKSFERDMLAHRNSLLKIKADSPTVAIYQDLHENDGYTYWEKTHTIPKRRIGTIYIPQEQKKLLVDTINEFFANKAFHNAHGIAHNLKILLYGPPGPQPDYVLIPTPTGWRPIGEIQPGDEVYAPSGKPTKVEHIVRYDDLKEYSVVVDDNNVVVGEGHKFLIKDLVTGEDDVELTVEEVKSRLYDYSNRVVELGRASGSIMRVRLGGEVEMPEQACAFDPYKAGLRFGRACALRKANDGYIIPEIDDDEAADMNQLKAMSSSRDNVPECYQVNSIDVRYAFLQGLCAACGVINEDHTDTDEENPFVEMYFYRSAIAYDVANILRSLGFRPELGGGIYTGDNVYVTTVRVEVSSRDLHLFFKFKGDGPDRKQDMYYSRIRGVMRLGTCSMTCLHVEDESHMYLSSGYIPVCNSGKDSIAKMIASEWQRNIYYVTGGKNGKYIPNAIVDEGEDVTAPLMLISDIDKYPTVITEATVNMKDKDNKDEQLQYKQTFGNMINALDGVLSAEGRIIIMTTNHIEKFSDVFRRPGRINLEMEIGYVTPEVFRAYVQDFYNRRLPETIELKDKDLTVAQMQHEVVYLKMTFDEFVAKHVK